MYLRIKPHQNAQVKDYSEDHQESDCDGAGQEKGYPEEAKVSGFRLLVKLTLGDEEEKVCDQEIHCSCQ